jgi:hypothetical protein
MALAGRILRIGLTQAVNYHLEETGSYDVNNPPSTVVTTLTLTKNLILEQPLETPITATVNELALQGLLITFDRFPDFFDGLIVKIRPTYAAGELPFLEAWIHTSAGGWLLRRRISLTNVFTGVESGQPMIYDLRFSPALEDIDKVWVTMDPGAIGAPTMRFSVLQCYGFCTTQGGIPPCDPADPLCQPPGDCEADPVSCLIPILDKDPLCLTHPEDCEPLPLDLCDPDSITAFRASLSDVDAEYFDQLIDYLESVDYFDIVCGDFVLPPFDICADFPELCQDPVEFCKQFPELCEPFTEFCDDFPELCAPPEPPPGEECFDPETLVPITCPEEGPPGGGGGGGGIDPLPLPAVCDPYKLTRSYSWVFSASVLPQDFTEDAGTYWDETIGRFLKGKFPALVDGAMRQMFIDQHPNGLFFPALLPQKLANPTYITSAYDTGPDSLNNDVFRLVFRGTGLDEIPGVVVALKVLVNEAPGAELFPTIYGARTVLPQCPSPDPTATHARMLVNRGDDSGFEKFTDPLSPIMEQVASEYYFMKRGTPLFPIPNTEVLRIHPEHEANNPIATTIAGGYPNAFLKKGFTYIIRAKIFVPVNANCTIPDSAYDIRIECDPSFFIPLLLVNEPTHIKDSCYP